MKYKREVIRALLLIFTDIISWCISIFIIMSWRIVSDKQVLTRYFFSFSAFALVWILSGLLVKKYGTWRKNSNKILTINLLFVSLLTVGYAFFHCSVIYPDLSVYVMLGAIFITASINFFILLLYYAYQYATNMEEELDYPEREPVPFRRERKELDETQIYFLDENIVASSNTETLYFLRNNVDLYSNCTLVLSISNAINIQHIPPFYYNTFVNLMLQNNIEGINKLFCLINQKLPDNGVFVCCLSSNQEVKKKILNKYVWGINFIVYFFNFIFRRVIPKILVTNRLYFNFTKGKKRLLSDTEILGRLYYCGFEVDSVSVVNGITFVKSHRAKEPEKQINRLYGLFIKLNRVGKDGKMIKVYKFRTMHPYSEYLQPYIFEKNKLQDGGKIKNDERITTLGKIMRKYWIDEWPMFINLMKGEMKLVGVRPLSLHYFNLYSKELREMRVRFKPGLIPPFYADMPKTLDEIQLSELKYLTECDKKGMFLTDFKYFWKILANILFKKARSN